jgi:hypothetical protein
MTYEEFIHRQYQLPLGPERFCWEPEPETHICCEREHGHEGNHHYALLADGYSPGWVVWSDQAK